MLKNFWVTLWRHYDVISAKIAQNRGFCLFLAYFLHPSPWKKIVQYKNRYQCKAPNSRRLLVAKTCSASGTKWPQMSQRPHFCSKTWPTLFPFLRAFPWSNFKFRPIFWKLRELSFTVVETRNRHFYSFRAKNRAQKEQLAKNRQNLKKFDFRFLV